MQDGLNPSTQPPMSEPFSPTTSGISTQSTMGKQCTCGKEGCPSCRGEMLHHSYVYAIGKVMYRFPNRSLEAEFAQAIARKAGEEMKGHTHEEVIHKALTDPHNRYIARLICYVLNNQNVETYILVPTDPLDVDRLAHAIRAAPNVGDLEVIIGRRGPIASFEMCNGLMIPIVMVDQIYSFDRDTLMKAIPRPKGVNEDQFRKTTEALFNHIIQIADNTGATNEHRALNYLAVQYHEIYHRTQLMQDENYSFTAVQVSPSPLSGARRVVDVIFTYENRANRAIQKWFVRVDATEEFPFLVSHMQQYIEH